MDEKHTTQIYVRHRSWRVAVDNFHVFFHQEGFQNAAGAAKKNSSEKKTWAKGIITFFVQIKEAVARNAGPEEMLDLIFLYFTH